MPFPPWPRLYPILDTAFLPPGGAPREQRLRGWTLDLLAAGVTLLQYRNKCGSEAEVIADARILRAAAPAGACVLILNDYPALAVDSAFDGAHLGQEDMPAGLARQNLGPDRILGLSTHNVDQLVAAELTSADYLAVGPVFATTSKQNPDPVIGIEGLRRARALTKRPLVAIGGITLANCKAVIDAGADSVAVISSLFADAATGAAGKIASDFFANLR